MAQPERTLRLVRIRLTRRLLENPDHRTGPAFPCLRLFQWRRFSVLSMIDRRSRNSTFLSAGSAPTLLLATSIPFSTRSSIQERTTAFTVVVARLHTTRSGRRRKASRSRAPGSTVIVPTFGRAAAKLTAKASRYMRGSFASRTNISCLLMLFSPVLSEADDHSGKEMVTSLVLGHAHRVVRNLQEMSGSTGGVEQLDRSGAEMEGKAKSACRALSDLFADSLEEPAG